MSEPIKPGDLVVVVRPSLCTGANEDVGRVFRVGAVCPGEGISKHCQSCGKSHEPLHMMYAEASDGWFPFARLKRIPPLSELDDVKRDEEITA